MDDPTVTTLSQNPLSYHNPPAVTQFKYAEAARKFNHQYPAGLASHTGKKINLGAYGADSLPVGDEPLAPAGWSSVQRDQRPRREYLSFLDCKSNHAQRKE